jgi:hypothetical protein
MKNDYLDTSTKFKLISNFWVWISILVGVLVSGTSLLGILYQKTYSREISNWAMQAIGQDYVNLLVVAILFVSTYFATKKSVGAYFIWLGSYLYLTYAFAIYSFAVHFQFLFLP